MSRAVITSGALGGMACLVALEAATVGFVSGRGSGYRVDPTDPLYADTALSEAEMKRARRNAKRRALAPSLSGRN